MALQHIQKNNKQGKLLSSISKQRIYLLVQHSGAFLLNHWVNLLTIMLGLLIAIAIAIPFLSYLGLDIIAKPLFFSLHLVCAQIPSHSFFILGHQLGLCARNFSIYASMFLGSLAFAMSKKRLPGIPWWLWILMILPMAWDGITQMFGWRESTWELRLLTGALFGLANVWFALPLIQRALNETQLIQAQTPQTVYAYQQMIHLDAASNKQSCSYIQGNE
ncbi:MAG: hypothetical protein NVS4B7_19980 [Ktedonobacteraceae bacterium]